MKIIALVTLSLLTTTAALAEKISATPTGMSIDYNGSEAATVFNALKDVIKPTTFPGSTDKRQTIYVKNIRVTTYWHSALDETDPCFMKPGYRVELVDERSNNKKIEINEAGNCRDGSARAIATAFAAVGAEDFGDAAMGKSYFSVPSALVSLDETKTGSERYFLLATLGADVSSDYCK